MELIIPGYALEDVLKFVVYTYVLYVDTKEFTQYLVHYYGIHIYCTITSYIYIAI